MTKFLACFGRGRGSSSPAHRDLQQPSTFEVQLEASRAAQQIDNGLAEAAAAAPPRLGPDDCSSPFRSAHIVPNEEGDTQDIAPNNQELNADLFKFHASNSSNKSAPRLLHGLNASNQIAKDHLEGHLLPAGLNLTTLQQLLIADYSGSDFSTASVTTFNVALDSQQGPSSTTRCGGPRGPSHEGLSWLSPGPTSAGGCENGAPDLRSLTCEQLVRLCPPEDIISDMAGLTLIGQGRCSVACQALWRGARVAVKFSSSASLHPSSSAIIRQALVSKALAHPNVLQHYSVRCCRLAPTAPAEPLTPLPPPPPEAAAAAAAVGGTSAQSATGGGGLEFVASAPTSSVGNTRQGGLYDASAAAAVAADNEGLPALHHLSGPAAPSSAANGATTESTLAASGGGGDARQRLASAVQVEDLVASQPDAVASGRPAAAAAGALPPLLHTTAADRDPPKPLTGGSVRVLKAPKQLLPPKAKGGIAAAADAKAASSAGPAAAAPPPLPSLREACTAVATSGAAGPRATSGGAATSTRPAASTAAGSGAAAAGAAAATTASPGGSLSFNSYEGFGNPFGSLRHALGLGHVAALVSAAEGEYLTAIIMEHADKATLREAVLRGLFQPNRVWSARVALRALLRTSLELAFALQHLHGTGVVHGSLRPANVMLKSSTIDRRGFTVKVSNFSLARVCLGDYDSLVLTPAPPGLPSGEQSAAAGVCFNADTLGTLETRRSAGGRRSGNGGACGAVDAAALPFWSPEQLCGVVGKPSDVYAFGVTLYFMITGSLPYNGIPAREVVRGVAAGSLRPQWPEPTAAAAATTAGMEAAPAAAAAALPPAPLLALCAQCWQTDPRVRPTFSQICASLQAIEHAIREQLRRQTSTDSPSNSGPQALGPTTPTSATATATATATAAGGSRRVTVGTLT